MAVHLPLSAEAQAEARIFMLSANSKLSPAHGQPLATPTQDMILGAYYLTYGPDAEVLSTIDRATHEPRPLCFRTAQEAELSYELGGVKLHDPAEQGRDREVLRGEGRRADVAVRHGADHAGGAPRGGRRAVERLHRGGRGRDGREPRRPEPHLHDGQLRCPRLVQADPPAGGH